MTDLFNIKEPMPITTRSVLTGQIKTFGVPIMTRPGHPKIIADPSLKGISNGQSGITSFVMSLVVSYQDGQGELDTVRNYVNLNRYKTDFTRAFNSAPAIDQRAFAIAIQRQTFVFDCDNIYHPFV